MSSKNEKFCFKSSLTNLFISEATRVWSALKGDILVRVLFYWYRLRAAFWGSLACSVDLDFVLVLLAAIYIRLLLLIAGLIFGMVLTTHR